MRRKHKFLQALIIILCVVTAAVMVFLVKLSRNSQQQQETALEKKASELEQAAETEKTAKENKKAASSSESETETDTESETETETSLSDTISCRGDAFWDGASAISATYPEDLEKLLKENNLSIKVEDYTWEMAGSLSQMRLAGISEDVINSYIEAHKNSANASSLSLTDQQLRTDMASKDLTRDDYDAIPVICIGYYGGWGNDLDELIEQEQAILDTYNDKEHYIVMGYYPENWTDTAAYDEAHEKAFGSHYLSLNDYISGNVMSDTGRQQVAEALYDKLKELGYLNE